jgi:hypothetical protein
MRTRAQAPTALLISHPLPPLALEVRVEVPLALEVRVE